MKNALRHAVALLGLAAAADAQVRRYEGPSPNVSTVLDFDAPFVASGPISSTSPVFTGAGISSVSLVGGGFTVAGDTLTAGNNVNGQVLIVQNGVMTVAGAGAPLDNQGIGDGYDVVLAAPVDEFQVLFCDQINMTYSIELFLGATSLGLGNFTYANPTYPFPPHYWRAVGSRFDRARITFPAGAAGVGLDQFAFGNGPAPLPPANDECAQAIVVGFGATPFDNSFATPSAPGWPCLADAGADLWFRYTETVGRDLQFSTCGSSYDTGVQVFTGSCGALTPVGCNDDACGTSSRVFVTGAAAGTVYYVRIGGWRSDTGPGVFTIAETFPSPASCVTSTFNNNNQGNSGGAMYFDLTVTQPVTIDGMLINAFAAVGASIGLELYTVPGTYLGNETNAAAWTLGARDDGTSVSAGAGFETPIRFVTPLMLAPGTYGIALVGRNSVTGRMQAHAYTNGTGANQNFTSADGVLALALGAASNVPFTAPLFTPRVWNGRICYVTSPPIGTSYCTAASNSTGMPALLDAFGSAVATANDVELVASQLPPGAFNYFLVSQTQGFVANPGGSQGNLCLGGQIGRYVGPGLIVQSNAMGERRLTLDVSAIPLPVGTVAATAGATFNWQCWYRDQNPGITSNFTPGRSITFQ